VNHHSVAASSVLNSTVLSTEKQYSSVNRYYWPGYHIHVSAHHN